MTAFPYSIYGYGKGKHFLRQYSRTKGTQILLRHGCVGQGLQLHDKSEFSQP